MGVERPNKPPTFRCPSHWIRYRGQPPAAWRMCRLMHHYLVGQFLSSEVEHRASGIVGESDKPGTKPGDLSAGRHNLHASRLRKAEAIDVRPHKQLGVRSRLDVWAGHNLQGRILPDRL
jgi:hypothetical protein